MSDIEEIDETYYGKLRNWGSEVVDALEDLKEERDYFTSSYVSDMLDEDLRPQQVGMVLGGMYALGVIDVYNSESNESNIYDPSSIDSDGISYFLDGLERHELEDFFKELAPYLAEKYRSRGFDRSETAEKLADLTGFSPSTYASKFSHWGIRWGQGVPEEFREEAVGEAEQYSKRKEATEELSERYGVSPRTIGNWLSEESVRFEHSEEVRQSALSQLRLMKSHSFPRGYSERLISDLEDVPGGTVHDWMKGEIRFEED